MNLVRWTRTTSCPPNMISSRLNMDRCNSVHRRAIQAHIRRSNPFPISATHRHALANSHRQKIFGANSAPTVPPEESTSALPLHRHPGRHRSPMLPPQSAASMEAIFTLCPVALFGGPISPPGPPASISTSDISRQFSLAPFGLGS